MREAGDEPLFAERAAGTGIAKAGIEVTIRVPGDTRAGRRADNAQVVQFDDTGTADHRWQFLVAGAFDS
jgi:hypothetical protein